MEDGTVQALSEREFSNRTGAAARALIQDHQAKVNELLRRFYR